MLKWYHISGNSEEGIRNVFKSLREQKLMVRKQNNHLFACISTHHQGWLSKVCQDFNATLKTLDTAPEGIRAPQKEEYIAPCGEKIYDPLLFAQHCRWCPKCQEIKSPKVVAKLEPGQEYNLNGVIASLEVVRDQLWGKLEDLDSLLTNMKAYRDSKDKLSELSTEVGKRVETVRMLLREGKF